MQHAASSSFLTLQSAKCKLQTAAHLNCSPRYHFWNCKLQSAKTKSQTWNSVRLSFGMLLNPQSFRTMRTVRRTRGNHESVTFASRNHICFRAYVLVSACFCDVANVAKKRAMWFKLQSLAPFGETHVLFKFRQ